MIELRRSVPGSAPGWSTLADVDQDGGVTGSVTGADLGAFFTLYEAGGC